MRLGATPPVIPDADEARDWAEQELAQDVYRRAEPTAFDRAAREVADVVGRLFDGDVPGSVAPLFLLIVVLVVVGLIVVALLIWGRPRATTRSRAPLELFGETEERSADELRVAARTAAARGEWDEAIVLRFRALARALVERTILDPEPGATVHRFARTASRSFPDELDALDAAADVFDDVRYLRRPGTDAGYRRIADLDERLSRARPRHRDVVSA